MGSQISKYVGSKATVSPPPPPLLGLPIDLVLMICGHLETDPASRCSLAMTCKSLFSIVTRDGRLPQLETESRNAFLCLLERDIGDRFYLCCSCSKFRRFDKSWGPTEPSSYQNCERLINSALWSGKYVLGYHDVRLVMHHHRSGGTRGVPLENLHRSVAVKILPEERYTARWRQDWTARVINNELFLSAHHTLQPGSKAQLWRALTMYFHMICPHISTHPEYNSLTGYPSPAPLQGGLKACWEVPGSCARCLTDFTLTIERYQEPAKPQRGEKWRLSITTYHQVGDGMSPSDWKWLAYSDPSCSDFEDRHGAGYPPGLIRETWNSKQS